MNRKKLHIKTYGCQMNVYDSDRMADLLKPLGYELTDTSEGADMVILNTCHIREKATEKVYSDLGRIKPHKQDKAQSGSQMIVAVAGCVGQAEGGEILRRAPYVNMVFGPQTYHRLPEMIAQAARQADSGSGPGRGILDVDFPIDSKFDMLPKVSKPEGASAFLTIQEGCDKFCRFCCVPYTRGAEYSRPGQDILDEASRLVDQGIKEITLLGQNVNAYHGLSHSGAEWGLGRLITVLSDLTGLERIRYTTSHPRDMDEELIAAHGEIPKLMPCLHLPVQSGSNKILNEMNRRHDREFYLTIIEKLKKARPEIAFSSDFIVGYPGETEADFQDTLDLIRQVGFSQAFSFKYSRRPGTPAAGLVDQVPDEVKTSNLQILQNLVCEQQLVFNRSMIGTTQSVLFEKPGRKEGQVIGKSSYLQSVYVEAPSRIIGQILEVHITDAGQNSLTGEIKIV